MNAPVRKRGKAMNGRAQQRVGSPAVTAGRVVSEEGRRWVAGEIDEQTYFEHVFREARDVATRDVNKQLGHNEADDCAPELAEA